MVDLGKIDVYRVEYRCDIFPADGEPVKDFEWTVHIATNSTDFYKQLKPLYDSNKMIIHEKSIRATRIYQDVYFDKNEQAHELELDACLVRREGNKKTKTAFLILGRCFSDVHHIIDNSALNDIVEDKDYFLKCKRLGVYFL